MLEKALGEEVRGREKEVEFFAIDIIERAGWESRDA